MRSFKKLLVSALVPGILCSSVSSIVGAKGRSKNAGPGMSRNTKVAMAMGIPISFTLATAITIGIAKKKASSSTSKGKLEYNIPFGFEDDNSELGEKEDNLVVSNSSTKVTSIKEQPVKKSERRIKFENDVACAKEKIVGYIGEEKYEFLRKVCEELAGYAGWSEDEYFSVDAVKLSSKVRSIKLFNRDTNFYNELNKTLEISNFLTNKRNRVNGFSRNNIFGTVNGSLRCVTNGVSINNSNKISSVSDDSCGNGFRYTAYEGKLYYEVFVSNNCENIKFRYFNSMDGKECTIILKV